MLTNIVAPAIAGVLLAAVSLFGVVSSTIGAPSANPAKQAVITYGDR
ncbi:hypothetical protein [Yimella sp. cx-51]|nr:hypothetical protein [Yimella sp. cx-51]MBC9957456.1 hypothetical protein [Yimella sp. cx-51]QTH39308.1 hypothetical protein J5M86_06855 [Yimella sp. cx-51]